MSNVSNLLLQGAAPQYKNHPLHEGRSQRGFLNL